MKKVILGILLIFMCSIAKATDNKHQINKLINSQNYSAALKNIDSLIQLKGDKLWHYELKGSIFVKLENYEKAIVCFRKALKLGADKFTYLLNIGDALFKNGQHEKAFDFFYWLQLLIQQILRLILI